MMRLVAIMWVIAFCIVSLEAQELPNRYQEEVFTGLTETNDILFSTGVPQPQPGGGFYQFITGGLNINADETEFDYVDLKMDIFEPTGDTLSQRPLVILAFGGGFVTGSRDYWSIRLLAQELARQGYVTASIDYRLGMYMFDAELSKRSVYRGLQDGRSAIRFFRNDAATIDTYRIDPDQIYIGGHSAGAFIGTHAAYLDTEDERPVSTLLYSPNWTNDVFPDMGCLDCVGDNQSYDGKPNGVLSLAGAVGDLDYMDFATDPSIVMFHSEDDGTVDYGEGEPFSDISFLVIGSDLPVAFGSSLMADRADALGLPNEFYSYTNRGHGVHENDPVLYTDIVPSSTDWFYEDRLKPDDVTLTGPDIICDDADRVYHSTSVSNGYYDWSVTGELSFAGDFSDIEVVASWDITEPTRQISVTPYSKHRARGNTITIPVGKQDIVTNEWMTTSGSWSDPTSWSMMRVPRLCDEVVISDQSENYTLVVPSDVETAIRSLIVYPGATIILGEGSKIEVVE